MKTSFIPLVFVIVFSGCAYFEHQRIVQAELDLAEFEANARELFNSTQGDWEYVDSEELKHALADDIYDEALEIAKDARDILTERKEKLAQRRAR